MLKEKEGKGTSCGTSAGGKKRKPFGGGSKNGTEGVRHANGQ